jgi:thiol-disulfide isomerase/thioredoxin
MRASSCINPVTGFCASCLAILLIGLACPSPIIAADPPPRQMPKPYQPAEDEFADLSKQLIELLQSHDTAKFANAMAPSAVDWKSIFSTNMPGLGDDPAKHFESMSRYAREKIELGAKALLERANALHLDFSKGDLHPSVSLPKRFGYTHYGSIQAEGESLPHTEKIEITLHPDSFTNSAGKGDFKIAIRGLQKFPSGWRSMEGAQWEEFPKNFADEKSLRELALLNKVAARESISGHDDPALLKLGEALVRFVRSRDLTGYQNEVLVTSDLVWAQFQKMGKGSPPSREEVDKEFSARARTQLQSARELLKLMDDAGVDLKNVDIQIKDAAIKNAQSQGASGSLDNLMGSQFSLKLAVKTDARAKNGASLSGDYIFSARRLMRIGDDWRIEDDSLHWSHLPEGILDAKAIAAMELENYVSEYGTLPPHTTAPEIELTTLEGGKKVKLSDLQGKVVVLDFWATWCGPCQEPMAKLQTLWKEHPDWQDKVAIVPLSIDDTIDVVQKHVNKRGWTNTFNVWAGEGGWRSKPATTFRVTGVPTTYIIDGQGQIIRAGHPAAMDLGREVAALLKP